MTEQLLVAKDVYLKSGIHIGTKFKTRYMEQFIYTTRPDGLTVLNLQKIDERLRTMASFLSQYNPEDILIVSRRETSWKALEEFRKATGIRIIAGRYPPGILTNPALDIYTEIKIAVVTDPWPDRNVVNDALIIGIPVIALCDTNNNSNNIDLVVPCNNKGKKSLGLLFYIVAREYLKLKGIIKEDSEFTAKLEDFSEE